MADLTRIKDPLEIAASSTDAAVRALALKAKALKREQEVLDGFFSLYAGEIAVQVPVKQPVPPAAPKTVPVQTKRDDTGTRLHSILKAAGPLGLDEVIAEYKKQYPTDDKSSEAIRIALKRKAEIVRVSDTDRRYTVSVSVSSLGQLENVAA